MVGLGRVAEVAPAASASSIAASLRSGGYASVGRRSLFLLVLLDSAAAAGVDASICRDAALWDVPVFGNVT